MPGKIRSFLDLIKFEHTIFALPFAYLGMLLSARSWPSFGKFFWITAAMVGARTAGMTLNRILDLDIDRLNPRTRTRPILTGAVSLRVAWMGVAFSLLVFFLAAWMLNLLCFKLSFIAILFLVGYHHVKRFSYLCHFVLGLVLAIAPIGGWIAVTGLWAWEPLFLSLAVLFWVAGFDILYSLQDLDFDRSHRLHSIPVRFGETKSLEISNYCHAGTALFLILFGFFMTLGIIYWVGVLIVAGLLYAEHHLLKEGDLSYINAAFFSINGWVGVLLLVFTFLEIFR